MAEFIRVEHPVYSPTRCALCARVEGPMVSVNVEPFEILTAHGVVETPGHVYICLGTDQIPGCAPQMARLGGMVDKPLHDAALGAIDQLREEIAALTEQVAELESGAPHVVSLDTARELIAAGKPTVPARPKTAWDG